MSNHLTRRGALLAQMESRCIEPGLWTIEGHQVRRGGRRGIWIIPDLGTAHEGFEEALEHLADYLEDHPNG